MALHFDCHTTRRTEPRRQTEAETFEDDGGVLVWLSDAGEMHLSAVFERKNDINGYEAFQIFDDRRDYLSDSGLNEPPFEGLPHRVDDEAHQDVGIDTVFTLMSDRSDAELGLLYSERGLGVGEPHICRPKFFGLPVLDVGAQPIGAVRKSRVLGFLEVLAPF